MARRYHCQAHATHAHAHAHAHIHQHADHARATSDSDHAVLPDVHAPVAHAPIENLFK